MFLAGGVFSDGYTKVAQKCDGLAERVGGTGVKLRFYRKTAFMGRGGPGIPQKFPKSSRFVRTSIETMVPVVGKSSVKVQLPEEIGSRRHPAALLSGDEVADDYATEVAGVLGITNADSLLVIRPQLRHHSTGLRP